VNALWFLAGALLSGLLLLTQALTVARLHAHTAPRALMARVVAGVLFRWMLIASLLIVALRQGVVPGLWAFAGLWVMRWPLIYLIHRRRLFARLLQ